MYTGIYSMERGHVTEVTWRAKSEVAEAMKVVKSILMALSEPVLVLDKSLRAVIVNPALCDVLRITPRQLEGESLQELAGEKKTPPALMALIEAVVGHNGRLKGTEIVCTVAPRTRKVLSVSTRRFSVGRSPAEMLLVELRDVTREKEAKHRIKKLNQALKRHGAQLEKINKELESYTQSVTHDLRTPLRLTNKVAHLLLEDYGAQLPANAVDKIHMILNSTQQMAQLIEDLLVLSRLSREPIRKRRVDTGRLVREVLAEMWDVYAGRNVEAVIEELPACRADRALLKQVFVNLLGNALKFTQQRERTEVGVGFMETNNETVYFIRDNGIGFDTSESESLFLPFHRLTNARDFEGSGIGLALAKRIIERHDGRIWVESMKDRGTTFCFTLGT